MQPVVQRGSIDKPLTFDLGLIQLSFIPICSPNTCNILVKLHEGLHFSAFHCIGGCFSKVIVLTLALVGKTTYSTHVCIITYIHYIRISMFTIMNTCI